MYDSHLQKLKQKEEIREIRKEKGPSIFFNELSNTLDSFFTAYRMLSTEMVQRGQNNVDKLNDFIGTLGNVFPLVGAPVFGIGTSIISYVNNRIEDKKTKKIAKLIPVSHGSLCKNIAAEITKCYKDDFIMLSSGNGPEFLSNLSKIAVSQILLFMLSANEKTIKDVSIGQEASKDSTDSEGSDKEESSEAAVDYESDLEKALINVVKKSGEFQLKLFEAHVSHRLFIKETNKACCEIM
jgi:hypothetical protein